MNHREPSENGIPVVRACAWLLIVLLQTMAAGAEDGAVLWPEREREFLDDGPGLLLSAAEREELLLARPEERSRRIDTFLSLDPIPETETNELLEGIAARRALAFSDFNTFLDDRARALFLHGEPLERRQVECGQTFQPIEVWTYPESLSRHKLLFYRRGNEGPHRLWIPLDSKIALYNKEMAYWLQQYEELRNLIRSKRFDIKACGDALFVDEVTGVSGLRGFQPGRPTNEELLALLEAPEDLASWARAAASTAAPDAPARLEISAGEVFFPERRGQRIVVRQILTVPPGAKLGLSTEGEETGIYIFTVEGLIEQDGTVFEEFRARFKIKPPAEQVPLGLAVERALRPDRLVVLRLKVIDEVTGAEARFAKGMRIPRAPQQVAEIPVPDVVIAEMEEALAAEPIAGQDSLLLAPPDGRLALGTWRAEALVSGNRIVEVVFSVDGRAQLRRKSPPWSADLRLAEYPTEQVVTAEGFDAAGELVAADQVVLNQPRGSFSVRILSPAEGDRVSGTISARVDVAVPDERRVERVEFRLNEDLLTTLREPPWEAPVQVPDKSEDGTAYLSVTAMLDNGERAEAVRFLNSPQFVENLEVNLVEMLVTVLDGDNRPVQGLVESDFEVFEDSRPQVIDRFELVKDLPLSIGFAIDTSGSMATSLPEAQKAAAGFLRSVIKPKDRAFLLTFSKDPLLLVPPTDDLRAIEASLEDLQSLGWTALHDAIVTGLYYFRGFRGQRALILLSDGDDSASQYSFKEALEYARRSGVVIYTVGLDSGNLRSGVQNKLSKLASETGGRHFFIRAAAELQSVYREIEQELRSQYFIAYSSDNSAADGAFRTIELEVRDGKLSARALRGYYPD